MANAAGMACRVVCSAVFIRRFFLQGTPAAAITEIASDCVGSGGGDSVVLKPNRASKHTPLITPLVPPDGGQQRDTTKQTNLWREVVAGALPHPVVVTAMGLSSAVAYATSPPAHEGVVPWNVTAATKHVGFGLACFVTTTVFFTKFEREFLKEVRALWTARRRPGYGARNGVGGGVVEGRDKQD